LKRRQHFNITFDLFCQNKVSIATHPLARQKVTLSKRDHYKYKRVSIELNTVLKFKEVEKMEYNMSQFLLFGRIVNRRLDKLLAANLK